MKKTMNIFMILLSSLMLHGCQEKPVVLPTGTGEPGFNINPSLDQLWVEVNASDTGFDTARYFEFILEACELGWDQKYIGVALQRFCEQQVQEGVSMGEVPRYVGGNYSDKNNIEFALELAGPALIEYYPEWTDANKALFDDFVEQLKRPDIVVLAEIYAARERNTIGISSRDLAAQIPGSVYCETLPEVTEWLRQNVQPGDVVLTVGAGDIFRAGEALLK